MDILQAVILGIVEGITEYLPVSSTGHLILTQRALGIPQTEAANAYAIAIQAGAILAVLRLYWARVAEVFRGVRGQDEAGRRMGICLVVAFLPAAVIGLLFDDLVEQHLFGLWPITAAWIVGGIVILASPLRQEGRELEELTPKQAFTIGLCQCVALWPGTSRSLVTILGGSLVGLSLTAAVEFSFLLGVITLGAATCYSALSHGAAMVASYGPAVLLVGFVTSWLSAFLAVKWMVQWISQRGMALFGYWRIGLGVLVIALLWQGVL